MATIISPPEQRVILHNISWETYERLLVEHEETSGTRFTYDEGTLQIMVLSAEHERANRTLALFVEVLAEEAGIDVDNVGSNTFKRESLRKGFEPDTAFYIASAPQVEGKRRIDLTIDPPPDLVIEIDITHGSLNKLPIFAAVGVPEVWRYDGAQVTIFKLVSGNCVTAEESAALPKVTGEILTRFMRASETEKRTAWLRQVRAWAREQK